MGWDNSRPIPQGAAGCLPASTPGKHPKPCSSQLGCLCHQDKELWPTMAWQQLQLFVLSVAVLGRDPKQLRARELEDHLGAPDQGYSDGVYLSVTIYGFMTYKLWDQSVSQTEQELLMHLDGGNNGKRYGKTPQSGIPHGMES